jgi:hypothetical protein
MASAIELTETAELATEAFAASGCQSHEEFVRQFGDAVGLRTFRYWLSGQRPALPLAKLMLREYIAGWRPSQQQGAAGL